MNDIPADRAVFYDFDRGPFTMHPLGLTPAFQAILAFAHAKLQVNSLQALVDSLNRCLVPIVKKEPISKTESGWVKVEEQQTDSPHPWEKYNDE